MTDREGEVHLLLTDVTLPKMSGRDLAARLTGDSPSLRVLFISGYPDPMRDADSFLAPGVQLLEKPFAPQVLLTRIRALLS